MIWRSACKVSIIIGLYVRQNEASLLQGERRWGKMGSMTKLVTRGLNANMSRVSSPDTHIPRFKYELAQTALKRTYSNAEFQKFPGSLFYIPFYVVCQFQVGYFSRSCIE